VSEQPAIRHQADNAIAEVVEGACTSAMSTWSYTNGRGCCPCCGDTYKASNGRLEVRQCNEHGRECDHWEAIWAAANKT